MNLRLLSMIVCMICGMILWMSLWALKEEHCTDNHLLPKQAAIAATTAASKWGSVKSWLGPCFQSKSPYPLTPANGFCNATAPRKEAMLAKTAWPMPITITRSVPALVRPQNWLSMHRLKRCSSGATLGSTTLVFRGIKCSAAANNLLRP